METFAEDAAGDDVVATEGRRGRTALVAAVCVAGLVALFVSVLATGDPGSERRSQGPLLGRLAPAVEGTTLDGEPFDMDDWRGRWVAVNFFASWCTPCIQEHPELVAFDEAHREAGDAAVVSVPYDDRTDDAKEFFAKRGGAWQVGEAIGRAVGREKGGQ